MAESGNTDASGPKAGGRHVAAGPRESSHSWELPAQRKVAVGASARLPQTPASSLNSRPGAGVPGVLEMSRLAQAPSVPPTTSPEAEGQLVPIQDALGNPDLPGAGIPESPFRGMPRSQTCGFCPQGGRATSA